MKKYFILEELIVTDEAKRNKISNIPNKKENLNIINLLDNILNPLVELYNKPISIVSGFRGEKLNDLVNGVRGSLHRSGQAVDIRATNTLETSKLFELLKKLPFDLLIYKDNLIHVSYSDRNRREIIII